MAMAISAAVVAAVGMLTVGRAEGAVSNPLAGMNLWVNPNSSAATAAAALTASGDTTDAALINKIATKETGVWLTDSSSATLTRASQARSAATAAGQVPVIVVYNLPNRDCGGFSAGGANTAKAYATWIRKVATALTGGSSIVVLEPDAIPLTVTGCLVRSARSVQSMLSDAITVLKAVPGVHVYLDAGNSGWVVNPTDMTTTLTRAGVKNADGFSLNVSNFMTTADTTTYGLKLTAALGGVHMVIDTSRNGLGPLPSGSGYLGPSWCNPPGRALGTPPTTTTGVDYVDGYLWVKIPGESDGVCVAGQPPAGTWWTDYALGLASRASW
jgi:endoglucanase